MSLSWTQFFHPEFLRGFSQTLATQNHLKGREPLIMIKYKSKLKTFIIYEVISCQWLKIGHHPNATERDGYFWRHSASSKERHITWLRSRSLALYILLTLHYSKSINWIAVRPCDPIKASRASFVFGYMPQQSLLLRIAGPNSDALKRTKNTPANVARVRTSPKPINLTEFH